MTKSKILILTDWYPPAYKSGGPVQSVYNLVELLKENFQCYAVTSSTDLNSPLEIESEDKNRFNFKNGVELAYYDPEYLKVKQLRKIIKDINPKAIYINGLFNRYFSILLLSLLLGKSKAKLIISVRGMLRPSALKYKSVKKRSYIILLRLLKATNKLLFHCTNFQEAKDAKDHFGTNAKTRVLSNIPYQSNSTSLIKKNKALRLVYAARVHSIKGLLQVLESLQSAQNEVELTICGVIEDETYWAKCLSLIKNLPKNIAVTNLGSLPHGDLMSELLNHHVYILPTLGENFGHSIYEALSAGLPVIISDQTPWRNLEELNAGFDIPLDQPKAFTAAIEKFCLMDNSEFSTWRIGARKLAEDFIQEQDYLNQYSELFRSYKKVGLVSPLPLTRYKGGISVFTNKILAETNDFKQEGVQLIHLNTCVIPRTNESSGRVNLINFRNYIRFLWKTYRSIQRNDIRQLHVHSSTGFSLLKDTFTGWLFSKLLSTQNILNIHYAEKESIFYKNWGYKLSKYFIKNGFREVIVLGQDIKQLFVEIGFPKDKIHILSYFHRKSLAARINKQPIERVSLLFLGSLDERKGVLDVLEALCEVPDSNWSLNIAGQFITSAFEADFMNSSSYARLKHKINLLGYIDGVAKEELLQASDILVLPSHGEGLPVSILEALFYNVAIITSNVGANKEHLNDICNLLEPGNISQLAEELNRAISDSVYLNERKKQGKSLSENYTFTAYKKEIIPIYQEL